MSKNHYYTDELFKLGKWALLPADSMSWHGQETCNYFKKEFGFGKGLLAIHTIEDGMQHMYCPTWFFEKTQNYIQNLKQSNYKAYEKKITKFYTLKTKAKREIPKLVTADYTKLSIKNLIDLYRKNRDWAHHVVIYDQFGWLSENVFDPDIDNILVKKLDLKKGSEEYNRVLFTLTKPEEISTTLEEKRDVLGESIAIIQNKKALTEASKHLTDLYGWMPVFAYGDPWIAKHYEKELSEIAKRDPKELENEYATLKKYREIRNDDIEKIVKQYNMTQEDLQVFIDFGLMLDARNEAEYVLSLAGYYLLPIYKEMARRLYVSIEQLRVLTEDEIIACLQERDDIQELLNTKRHYVGWGFDETMDNIIFFDEKESEALFKHVEKNAEVFAGPEENVGICASPGKVVGTARIIAHPKENNKIKEGDVLFAYATTVDYLPAMKKAAAFVTESGGLTCHAAVVAREFGVPCIVSLKDVMSKFKDDEKVEVDADKGIVRKI